MSHQLQLTVQDSALDNNYLLFTELSQWDPMLEVRDRLLQVLPPHGDHFVQVPFARECTTSVSAVHLCLSQKLSPLPDGLYRVHYSVSPHAEVFVELNHFRVAELMQKVLNRMATIDYGDQVTLDKLGTVNLTKLENTLLHIWMQLTGAQAIGRDLLMQERAQELYRQAYAEYDRLFDRDYV
jgi:hypothetical protein